MRAAPAARAAAPFLLALALASAPVLLAASLSADPRRPAPLERAAPDGPPRAGGLGDDGTEKPRVRREVRRPTEAQRTAEG